MVSKNFFLAAISVVLMSATCSATRSQCPTCPICAYPAASLFSSAYWSAPSCSSLWGSTELIDTSIASECLRHEFSRFVGNQDIVREVERLVNAKLRYPRDPLHLHFAGDNGVGKTFLAQLIALATSLRFGKDGNGGNLLFVSIPSYTQLSADVAYSTIIQDMRNHLNKYPRGVILLDDVNAYPGLVEKFPSIFGRGNTVATADGALDLTEAIIIVTSDFGRSGTTVGMNRAELQDFVSQEVQKVYSQLRLKSVRSFPFQPFGTEDLKALASKLIDDFPCRESVVSEVDVKDPQEKLQGWIRNKLVEVNKIGKDNGRAVKELIREYLDAPVALFLNRRKDVTNLRVELGWNATTQQPSLTFFDPTRNSEL